MLLPSRTTIISTRVSFFPTLSPRLSNSIYKHSTRRRPNRSSTLQSTTSIFTWSCSPAPPRVPLIVRTEQAGRLQAFAVMASVTQIRSHAGHSHGAGGHGDNAYLTSSNKNDAGVKITRVGLYVNLGMAIVKGIGGWAFNSKALTADAIHSLTDLVSDFMTLATVSLALKPPSAKFPSGYGKVESLGSLGVSGMLLVGGCLMGWSAIVALFQQFLPGVAELLEQIGIFAHSHHGHDHSHTDLGPNINAAWLAAGSILIKEWLYRATLKVAKERKSAVLASNAYHHRVDSLTAFVALLMIGGSNILQNASWMDPVGGLVISLMVIQAGLGNTKSSILELADASLDDDIKKRVRRTIEKRVTEGDSDKKLAAISVRSISGVKAGQSYLIDMELNVPGDWTVEETRHVEESLRTHIGAKVRGVKRVRIRFIPKSEVTAEKQPENVLDEFISADISPRSSPEPESDDDHNGAHQHGAHQHGNGHSKHR